MENCEVFTVRDLKNNASQLIKKAEHGQYSLITKHGHPAAITIPFDDKLLELGVGKSLALHLYEKKHITLSQAAKLSDVTIESFLEILKGFKINVVEYPPEELETDLKNIQ